MFKIASFSVNEFKKFLYSTKYRFFIIITFLFAAAFLAIGLLKPEFPVFNIFNGSNISLTALSVFSSVILPLFILMSSVDLFTNERETGAIRIGYISSGNRNALYFAKTIAIFYGAMFLTGILYLSISVISVAVFGTALGSVLGSFIVYLASVLPVIMTIFICSFVALWKEHSGGAITTAVFAYLALNMLSLLIPQMSNFLPQNYFRWHLALSRGIQQPSYIINGFLITLAYSIIFLSIGKYRFEKLEL